MDGLNEDGIVKIIEDAISLKTETHRVEFKDANGGIPKDLWEPITAFSNYPGGGMVVFGIKEDRDTGILEVVGCSNIAYLQEKIVSLLSEVIVHHGKYSLKILSYRGKGVLVLLISETSREQKPCYHKAIGLPNGACIRQGNTNRKITDEEMKTFIRYSADYRYDRSRAVGVENDTLSEEKIKKYLKKSADAVGRSYVDAELSLKVLKNLGIIGEFDGEVAPTMAGYLIFSKESPQQIDPFNRYVVRCIRYSGNSPSSSIVDTRDIEGTLDELIDGTHKFVLRNIAKSARLQGSKRVEAYEYPEEGVRELIANAIIHRDYHITGSYVQVVIFSNRIEIMNPGNLPPGVTIENIKESQFSRNEVVAKLLRDLEYMEEFGRGIDLVYAKMKEWGLVEPLFKNSSNMFKVTLPGQAFSVLNDRQVKIWHYINENRIITARYAQSLFEGISRPTINNDLKKMVDLELIVQKGYSNNTSYESKD